MLRFEGAFCQNYKLSASYDYVIIKDIPAVLLPAAERTLTARLLSRPSRKEPPSALLRPASIFGGSNLGIIANSYV